MNCFRKLLGFLTTLGALFAATASITPAEAQMQINRFRASETPQDDFAISRPVGQGMLGIGAVLHVDYANDPLDRTTLGSEERVSIIRDQATANFGLSLGLFERFVLFGGLPINVVMEGEDGEARDAGAPRADGFGLGDLYFGGRVHLWGEEKEIFLVGVQATATLGTAQWTNSRSFYSGEGIFATLHPELLVESWLGPVRANLNTGFVFRVGEDFLDVQNSEEWTWSGGVALPIALGDDHIVPHAQVFGSTTFESFFEEKTTPFEGLLGVKYRTGGLSFGATAGAGFVQAYGTPDYRVMGMAGWTSHRPDQTTVADTDGDGIADDRDQCPTEPEDRDGDADEDGCPDLTEKDLDGDGLVGDADQCPQKPEDVDGFEDEDGCPDDDNDGDGVPDATDKDPMNPEDVDGFEDEDGAPDTDNDGDGILDGTDECPDVTGPVENRGCPDKDTDEDGVVDRLDNCPEEPGSEENHGCKKKQLVVITESKLEILDKVYFASGRARIQRRSHKLLDNVAEVLNNQQGIKNIVVEGHTDSRGNRDKNVNLSQERAQAVVDYLVDKGGVDASRLEAKGYGPEKPIDTNDTRKGRANNRRVEFTIKPQVETTKVDAPTEPGKTPVEAAQEATGEKASEGTASPTEQGAPAADGTQQADETPSAE